MQTNKEKAFLKDVLHIGSSNPQTSSEMISGMGTTFDIYSKLNSMHYAATKVDAISPTENAFCALTYQDGQSACVAYNGEKYKTLALGFPFECITSEKKQATIMKGFMKFLMK